MIRKQRLLIWWQIMRSEELTAEKNNSQQCTWLIRLHQTMLRALMMPLCHFVGLFGSWSQQRLTKHYSPSSRSVGLWFSFVLLWFVCSVVVLFDTVSKSGRGHRAASLSIAETREHTREEAAQSRRRAFFSGLQGQLGDEQSPVQSWSSSCAHHYCILWQDNLPASVR